MPKLIVLNNKNEHIRNIEIDKKHAKESILNTVSILDIMIKNKINVRNGCTGGVCGACIARLIEGEEYVIKEGKNKAAGRWLTKGLFLSCIATIEDKIPEDINIKIKINEN